MHWKPFAPTLPEPPVGRCLLQLHKTLPTPSSYTRVEPPTKARPTNPFQMGPVKTTRVTCPPTPTLETPYLKTKSKIFSLTAFRISGTLDSFMASVAFRRRACNFSCFLSENSYYSYLNWEANKKKLVCMC